MSSRAASPRRLLAIGWVMIVILAGMVVSHNTFAVRGSATALSGWAIGLAAIWAVGGCVLFVVGPGIPADQRASRPPRRRAWTIVLGVAVLIAGGSLAGATILQHVPVIGTAIRSAAMAAGGAPLLVVVVALITGAAEELFFRIGLHRILPDRFRVGTATLCYTIATAATGNIALVVMAAVLGAACSVVLETTRRAIAPFVVHASWTLAMVGLYPAIS